MVKRMCCLTAVVALLSLIGCSKRVLEQTGYETLHNISDVQNDKDPRYDPGPRPSFEIYQQQREELLREQRPEAPATVLPVPPAAH